MRAFKSKERAPLFFILFFFAVCLLLGFSIIIGLSTKSFDPSVIQNIVRLFKDKELQSAVKTTTILFSISVSFQIIFTILTTIFFSHIPKKIMFLIVAPYAMGIAAPGFSLYVLLSHSIGPFKSTFLGTLLDTGWGAKFVIVFIDSWQWLGVLIVACFIIINQIPNEHFEQAELEGINHYRRWWLISRPEIRDVILLYFFIRLIDWFRKVDVIKIMFNKGGPGNSVETIGMYISKLYYQSGDAGYASFLSIVQVIVLGFGLFLLVRYSPIKKFASSV